MDDQLALLPLEVPVSGAVSAAVERLATAGAEERGAIFTRTEVVEFMLDLARYSADRPLHRERLLEPSFGGGDFLLPAIDRLVAAWREHGGGDPVVDLSNAIVAVEVHRATFSSTKVLVNDRLASLGIPGPAASELTRRWLINDDFLLADLPGGAFSHVIGNPPYVRQEMIADALMAEYRSRYETIFDRADLYVPFIQRSLQLLDATGVLSFICADRWMKNKYGAPLRGLVAKNFHLSAYVDMTKTQAFHSEVIAYPGIFVIDRGKGHSTAVSRNPEIDFNVLAGLVPALQDELIDHPDVVHVPNALDGSEPWLLDTPRRLALLRRLEAGLPLIEAAGCRVGIGVATGADKVFIGDYATMRVEEDRKLPLAMRRDVESGQVSWRGKGVINPFRDDGKLVDLKEYPLLSAYLNEHADAIKARNVAVRSPDRWYRTIDRIYPALAAQPKLLIPDIAGDAHIIYEDDGLYPHHNLYFITSSEWDLHALRALLISGVARLFVSAYSTAMRGGYMRFQAQYLRRIRVPHWKNVPAKNRKALIAASMADDRAACDDACAALYGFSMEEQTLLKAT